MSTTYYLAIDIGASSGRHMLAWKEEEQIKLQEVHRFSNGMNKIEDVLCWDVEGLFEEVLIGLAKCKELGKIPSYVGIDTWGVDFVLLDKEGNKIGKAVGYRDARTDGMDEKVYERISPSELYQRTGIQKQKFNTIFQLMAIKQNTPEILEQAEHLLMMPDYLHYRLTGIMKNEYTEATTGQLIHAATKDWDYELIERLGFPKKIFGTMARPGELLGSFTKEVADRVNYNCQVVLPPTHDTASAVVAVPTTEDDVLYISSGTWSLMGTERTKADCTEKSMTANITNEGGYAYRFRYLKNIMGLWMIQSVKKEWKENLSFGEICALAEKEEIDTVIDCNDDCFMAPDSMLEAVTQYCKKTGQRVPVTIGEIAAVIYNSLAVCYKNIAHEIEALTGTSYTSIHIIGGGANAGYLNELVAKHTGKIVYAGPTEATAIGNIVVQMLYAGAYKNLEEARKAVANSFEIKKYDNGKRGIR